MGRQLELYQLIERSIIKKYKRTIWNPFLTAVNRYKLLQEGDKIAVCISGGKDSMLMAKLMQQLQKYSDVPFDVIYLVMDPGYSEKNRRKIEENAALLHLPVTFFETNIFAVADSAGESPCYLCARMRRGHLYNKAKQLGCNKIALGHHMNDVIETTLMGMFYSSQMQGMMPKLRSANFEGMELIRPMYCINEADIIAWTKYNGLEFIRCACKLTDKAGIDESVSKRLEVKNLIKKLKKDNPRLEQSLFNSIHSVCIDTFPAYKKNGERHMFTDDYDK